MKLKLGYWVALTEDGLWYSPFKESQVAFATKRDLVSDISTAHLDPRPTPLVKRAARHRYIYKVKDCDTGHFSEEYVIVQVTSENIAALQAVADELDIDLSL